MEVWLLIIILVSYLIINGSRTSIVIAKGKLLKLQIKVGYFVTKFLMEVGLL